MEPFGGDRPFRACILGAPLDMGNLGVRALASSLTGLILDARPGAQIRFLYGNRTGGGRILNVGGREVKVEAVNCRLSPRARLREHILWILLLAVLQRILPLPALRRRIRNRTPWLRALDEADFVGDVRGGDSFSDIYGLERFVTGSLPCVTAILMGKPLTLLPQTYGPFRSGIARVLARWIFRRAKGIAARDPESAELVRRMLGKSPQADRVRLCPEVAFSLPATMPRDAAIQPPMTKAEGSFLVGLNVSGLLYMGGYTRRNMFGLRSDYRDLMRQLLAALLKRTAAHVLIVPHVLDDSEENDRDACADFLESAPATGKDRVHVVTGRCDEGEIKGIVGTCEFFVGSRMHACVAALSQGIPAVALAYSSKFLGVFETVGMGDMVLDLRAQTAETLIAECLSRLARRADLATRLKERLPEIRGRISSCFRDILRFGEDQGT